jgi:catechol 2,3-dioxygenase-like lactoylglutathione lyase family enzyme
MAVIGPDFISLQVRDLERSAEFYERQLGLRRSKAGPPHAIVFDTHPVSFAVRELLPGTSLDTIPRPGEGIALWLRATDTQQLHDALAAVDTPITSAPFDGPFGRTFTFADPDGYRITIHDAA